MTKALFSFVFTLTILLITSCVPRSLEPGSERVTVIAPSKMQPPKNCRFLGKISNSDVHGKELQFTWGLEQNLKLDDINFLKNEGKKLDANLVILNKHQTLIKRYGRGNRQTDVSLHVIVASAYSCPQEDIGTIKKPQTNISSVYETPIIIKNY